MGRALENPPNWVARTLERVSGPSGWALNRHYNKLAPESPEILRRVKSAAPIHPALESMFADYAHDSFAGFRPFDQFTIFGWDPVPGSWEPEGFFRWRVHYRGNDKRWTLRHERDEPESQVA